MIAYKIVRVFDGEFWSCTNNGIVMNYEVGKVTKRRSWQGPLTCFENLYLAKKWIVSYSLFHSKDRIEHFNIFECRIRKSRCKYIFASEFCHKVHLRKLPVGTVLCDSVTLLEKEPFNLLDEMWKNKGTKDHGTP